MSRETTKHKQLLKGIIGLLISVGAFWLILKDVNLGQVIDILKKADFFFLAAAFFVTFGSYVLRSMRWPILFRQNPPSFADSFRCLIVGFFMNNILPARIGELVRAHLGGAATKQSRSYVLATIALERLADGIVISLLFALVFTYGAADDEVEKAGVLFYVVYLFFFAGLMTAVLLALRHRVFALLERIGQIMPGHLTKYTLVRAHRFVEGLEPLLQAKKMFWISIWSIAVWAVELFVYYLVAQAYDNPLSIGVVALFLAAVNFSSLIPAAPGGIGVIELFATKALVLVGVDSEIAFAMVISQHLIQILVIGIPGSYFFFHQMRGKVPEPEDDLELEVGDLDSEEAADISDARPHALERSTVSGDDALKSFDNNVPAIDISIILPSYNEEDRLPKTLLSVTEYFAARGTPYEVLVVDDGSTDDTPKVVQQFENLAPEVKLLTYPENRGKGYAVRFGVLNAQGKLVLYNDADGATPIEEIERLEEAIASGAQIAIGSRAMFSRETTVDTLWYRKFLGRIFNGFVNFMVLPGIADTQCGFKLFVRPAAQYLFSRQKAERFSFDVEILFLARKAGYKIAEVPINWTDVPGSKVNLVKDSIHMGFDIIKFRLRDLFGGYNLTETPGDSPRTSNSG